MSDQLAPWRNDYASRVNAERRRFVFWRNLGTGLWAGAIILGGLSVWQAMVTNVTPYVSVADAQGRVVLGGKPQELNEVSKVVQRRFAQDFVVTLREIPQDDTILLQQLAQLKRTTLAGSPARQKAIAAELSTNETARSLLVETQTREVRLERVEEQEPGTWLVVWVEDLRSKGNGQPLSETRYQGVLRLRMNAPLSAEDLLFNPSALGVFDFDVIRLRGEG